MARRGRDDGTGRELMGASADMLFSDPLNVRDTTPTRQQQPQRQQLRGLSPAGGHSDSSPGSPSRPDDVRKEEDTEDWGVVGNFVLWMAAGGKQCCSMRDRATADAAAKAARPPEHRFPPPEAGRDGIGSFRPRDEPRAAEPPSTSPYRGPDLPASVFKTQSGEYAGGRDDKRAAGRSHDSEREKSPTESRGGGMAPGGVLEAWGQRDASASAKSLPPAAGQRAATPPRPDRLGPVVSPVTGPGQRTGKEPSRPAYGLSPAAAATAAMSTLGSVPTQTQLQSGAANSAPTRPQLPTQPQMGLGPSSSPSQMSSSPAPRWEWPTWALNFKKPSIEVYVVDDDSGRGRWVNAEPQSRVVDKSGRDAYLCVEYDWDGELYVQDFGPQHVRRRGETQTVFQFVERTQGASHYEDLDSTRLAPGRGNGNLDDTALAPGRGRPGDRGGGLSAFLENSQ